MQQCDWVKKQKQLESLLSYSWRSENRNNNCDSWLLYISIDAPLVLILISAPQFFPTNTFYSAPFVPPLFRLQMSVM